MPSQGKDHAKFWGTYLLKMPWLLASADALTECSYLPSIALGALGRLSGSHKDRLMLKRTLQSTGEGILNSSSSCSSPEDTSAAFRVCWSAATWTCMTFVKVTSHTYHVCLGYCSGISRECTRFHMKGLIPISALDVVTQAVNRQVRFMRSVMLSLTNEGSLAHSARCTAQEEHSADSCRDCVSRQRLLGRRP